SRWRGRYLRPALPRRGASQRRQPRSRSVRAGGDGRKGWSYVGAEPMLDLPNEAVEGRREARLVRMIRRPGGDGDRGPLSARVGQPDRPQVGVLDGPPITLDRGDRHRERRAVGFPWHDDRRETTLAAGVLLDRAGHDLW